MEILRFLATEWTKENFFDMLGATLLAIFLVAMIIGAVIALLVFFPELVPWIILVIAIKLLLS